MQTATNTAARQKIINIQQIFTSSWWKSNERGRDGMDRSKRKKKL
jgi:hypothetical protein